MYFNLLYLNWVNSYLRFDFDTFILSPAERMLAHFLKFQLSDYFTSFLNLLIVCK